MKFEGKSTSIFEKFAKVQNNSAIDFYLNPHRRDDRLSIIIMEESDDEYEQLNGEHVLADTLDVIFSYLKIKDLSNASLVCKSWHRAVLRELAKRGPDRQIISMSNNNIFHLLSNKPYAALLFVAPVTRQICGIKRDILDIVKRYKDNCPNYLVAIGVHYAVMDEEDVTMTPDLSGPSDRILGLFFPEYKDLKIQVGYHPDLYSHEDINKLLDDFVPNDTLRKSVIILFTQAYEDNSSITKLMKLRFKQRKIKYTLWGGSFFSGLLPIKNCQIDYESEQEFSRYLSDFGSTQPNGAFALSISGRNIDSWSMVISCLEKKGDFERKLLDFREKLRLKRRIMGFVCGPADIYYEKWTKQDLPEYYRHPEEFMKLVRKIFKGISFTGIFDVIPGSIFYGIDSSKDDTEQELEHKITLSVMIFTYD